MSSETSWIERTLGVDMKTLLIILGVGGATGGVGGFNFGSADAKLYDECVETRSRQADTIVEMRQRIAALADNPAAGIYYRSAPSESMEAEPVE